MSQPPINLGPVAKAAYDKGNMMPDDQRWEYVALSVVTAFDAEMNVRVSKMHRRSTWPLGLACAVIWAALVTAKALGWI